MLTFLKMIFLSWAKLGINIYLYKILYLEIDIKHDNISWKRGHTGKWKRQQILHVFAIW